jgi:predicted DNA-binding transcriptional regulator YafY
MTAAVLAKELEVSERTIHRDIEALSTSGVPVYAERGPGGGCALLESYRTNLTGLTAEEVQALFMLSIPAPLAQLGVSQELKAALLKLSAALPSIHRQEEQAARQRIFLDSAWWFQADEAVPFLQTVQRALWQNRMLRIIYRLDFGAQDEFVVSPYGLVAKTNVWYLVAQRDDHLRAYRVSRIRDAVMQETVFERPVDFNLVAFWSAWCADFEVSRPYYPVTARVAPELIPHLPGMFGESFRQVIARAAAPGEKGWLTLVLPFETFEAARSRILALGRAVEVLEPEALRCSVVDFARQTLSLYHGRDL